MCDNYYYNTQGKFTTKCIENFSTSEATGSRREGVGRIDGEAKAYAEAPPEARKEYTKQLSQKQKQEKNMQKQLPQ